MGRSIVNRARINNRKGLGKSVEIINELTRVFDDADPSEVIDQFKENTREFLQLMSFNSRIEAAFKKLDAKDPAKIMAGRRKNFVSSMRELFDPRLAEMIKLSPWMGASHARTFIAARNHKAQIDRLSELRNPNAKRFQQLVSDVGFDDAVTVLHEERDIRSAKERARTRGNYATWLSESGRNGTAGEFIKIRKEFGDRANDVWHTIISDIYESARDPKAFERRQFRLKFGNRALSERDRGEREAAYTRGQRNLASHRANRNFTFWYDNLSEHEQHRFDLIQHYGGGPEGIRMADERISRDRARSERERNLERDSEYRREMMDDYQAGYQRHYDRFGNAGMAEEAYKKELKKNLPSFFKHSNASSRDLHRIAQHFQSMREIPLVGKMLGGNPWTAGLAVGMAGWQAMKFLYGQVDEANTKDVQWKNAANLYGNPGDRFQKAAYLAGMTDPAKIAELYGKLTVKYGDAESIMDAFGSAMTGMSKKEKMFFANSLGISPMMAAMIDMYAGNLIPSENRKMNAAKSMSDVQHTLMKTSDKSATENLLGIFTSSSVGARAADIDFDVVRKARSIAEGDYNIPQTVNNSTTSNGGTVETTVNNYVTVNGSNDVEAAVGGATKGSLDAVRRTNNTDHSSSGFKQ